MPILMQKMTNSQTTQNISLPITTNLVWPNPNHITKNPLLNQTLQYLVSSLTLLQVLKSLQCNIQTNICSVGSNTRLLNRDVTVQVDTSCHSDDKLPSTKCEEIDSLIHNGTFGSFLEEIQNSKQTDAFCSLIKSIANRSLPTENIVWKSTLYRGKWSSLSSTHRIRFNTKYADFWGILKLLFSTSVINILRGPAHFGKIVTDEV